MVVALASIVSIIFKLEGPAGLEPATRGLKGHCSTTELWARRRNEGVHDQLRKLEINSLYYLYFQGKVNLCHLFSSMTRLAAGA